MASRIVRTACTASNAFVVVLLIAQYLTRRTNFERRVPLTGVDPVVCMNSRKVHDVPEVPTHEHIHVGDGRDSDVLRIREHIRGQNPLSEIPPGQLIRLRGQSNGLDVIHGNLRQDVADRQRRRLKFQKRQLRQDEPEVAADKPVDQPPGMDPELFVQAPPMTDVSV